MAELLSCKYIPTETHIVTKYSRDIEYYKSKEYMVKKLSNGLYAIKNPPKLEVIFRDDERDHVLLMLDDVRHYAGKKIVSQKDINEFVSKIVSGEICVEIQSDGSYTVSV